MPRSAAAHKIREGKVAMSSAQDKNAATRERVEPGIVRADGPGRSPAPKRFRVRLFKD